MDYGTAFTYVIQDEEWVKKILIAALFAFLAPFLGIGAIILVGWSMEIARRVKRGDEEILPDWTDFGKLFLDGLKFAGVIFVWMLFPIVVSICGALPLLTDNDTLIAIGLICAGLIVFVFAMLVSLLTPAAFGYLADTDDFMGALNPITSFNLLKANIGGYLIVWLINGILLTGIIMPLGSILCGIGVFATTAYVYAIRGHLYGQAYVIAQENMEAAGSM